MSRARDTADQINRVNSSAADATAITVDSSENVMLNTTNTSLQLSSSDEGFTYANNFTTVSRDGGTTAYFNRLSSDGDVVAFRKNGSTVGTIGAVSGNDLFIVNQTKGLRFQSDAGFIQPCNSTGSDSDNTLDLGQANSRFKDAYLSGGIYLGGTGSANKLEDYEEGTWTPASGSGTLTSGNQWYIKVGDMVTVSANVYNFSDRSSSNNVQITGLPFTSGNKTAVGSFMGSNISSSVGYSCYIAANESQVYFYEAPNAGNYETMKHNDLQTNADFYFCITYRA